MTTTTLTLEIMWSTCFRHCMAVHSTYNLDKHQKQADCSPANQDTWVAVHCRLCHTVCRNTFMAHQHKWTMAQQTTRLRKISTLQKHNVSQLCRHHSMRCPPPWRHPRLHGCRTLQEVSMCSLVCGTSWRWPQGCTNSSCWWSPRGTTASLSSTPWQWSRGTPDRGKGMARLGIEPKTPDQISMLYHWATRP